MASCSSASATNESSSFRFVVTGFGPFNGVPDNPTSILARQLEAGLQQWAASSNDPVAYVLAHCTETRIVETSAQAARYQVEDIRQVLEPFQSAIVLHLGVDAGSRTFKLERCAYNDATFRVPDEQGYAPNRVPIVDTCSVGSPLATSLDVPSLVNTMNQTLSSSANDIPIARPSSDPGRFVCNYIYCSSLHAFECAKTVGETQATGRAPPRVQCLFLHVPPFARVPEAQQLEFVMQLMSALYRQKKQAMEEAVVLAA